MNELFEYIGLIPAEFFKAAFEISLIGLFLLCLFHSGKQHGWKRTFREFTAGFFLTAGCETIGVLSGAYVYPGYYFYLFSIPIVNPASWISLVYIVMEITNRLVVNGKNDLDQPYKGISFFKGSLISSLFILALIDASLALVIDLVMDPLATIYNWWIWVDPNDVKVVEGTVDAYNFDHVTHMVTPDNPLHDFFAGFFNEGFRYPTRLFGIPLINFIAWFVFVFVFTIQFRWIEYKDEWSDMKKTLILWGLMIFDIPILCMLLIVPNF